MPNDRTGRPIPPPPPRTTLPRVVTFDPHASRDAEAGRTMRPSTRPGAAAYFLTSREARSLARTDRFGKS